MPDRICSVPECDRPYCAKSFCKMHWRRLGQAGTCIVCEVPFAGDARRQFCSPECRTAHDAERTVGYAGVHRRIQVERGRASQYPCVDCGQQARDWSYDNLDPDALIGDRGAALGLPYSLDPSRYHPRCKACHKVFDQQHGDQPVRGTRQHSAKLTEAQVREVRARYAAGGVGFQRLANEFGVSKKTVLNVVHRRVWAWVN